MSAQMILSSINEASIEVVKKNHGDQDWLCLRIVRDGITSMTISLFPADGSHLNIGEIDLIRKRLEEVA